ncbi:hypothetical protein PXK20_05620 [Phaeobacter gallaeciensis]|nr:hypothetical protein [Phaeobacter gallaeciensis]
MPTPKTNAARMGRTPQPAAHRAAAMIECIDNDRQGKHHRARR